MDNLITAYSRFDMSKKKRKKIEHFEIQTNTGTVSNATLGKL